MNKKLQKNCEQHEYIKKRINCNRLVISILFFLFRFWVWTPFKINLKKERTGFQFSLRLQELMWEEFIQEGKIGWEEQRQILNVHERMTQRWKLEEWGQNTSMKITKIGKIMLSFPLWLSAECKQLHGPHFRLCGFNYRSSSFSFSASFFFFPSYEKFSGSKTRRCHAVVSAETDPASDRVSE